MRIPRADAAPMSANRPLDRAPDMSDTPATGYSTYALADLLDTFAASDPVPGGGSAAALAGALGVSLLLMVAGMTRTRTGAPEEAADLSEAAARLRPIRERLTEMIDADAAAYAAVIAAYRLPKASEGDKAARREAIDDAMRGATDTPLDTLRLCQQALQGALVVAGNGAVSANSDVAVAIELLVATARGAARNVDVKLGSLKDAAYAQRTRAERQELEAESLSAAEDARRRLQEAN
jgi:methenyltetrahydrofolate cyclohydrolase